MKTGARKILEGYVCNYGIFTDFRFCQNWWTKLWWGSKLKIPTIYETTQVPHENINCKVRVTIEYLGAETYSKPKEKQDYKEEENEKD